MKNKKLLFVEKFNNLSVKFELAFAFTALTISGVFVMLYLHNTVVEPRASIEMLTSFKAHMPFQARLLSILLVKYIPLKIFLTLSVVAVIYSSRILLKHYEINNPFLAFVVILPMYANYFGFGSPNIVYPYDFMAVLFSALALLTLLKNSLKWFYFVFVLAQFNRETGAFLILFFLFAYAYKIRWKILVVNIVSQVIILVIIKGVLINLFSSNPGELIEWKFFSNINSIYTLGKYLPLVMGSTFAGLWIFSVLYFRDLDDSLKRFVLTVPITFIGLFIVGNMTELRIYSETIPVINTAAIYVVHNISNNYIS